MGCFFVLFLVLAREIIVGFHCISLFVSQCVLRKNVCGK